mmetsp:Transcript_26830/g.66807  ORF Transcript_26830/g.66807 Transcript_26830/m.66807 type:complete len:247 (+) Transcript_26830:788-1528(+)
MTAGNKILPTLFSHLDNEIPFAGQYDGRMGTIVGDDDPGDPENNFMPDHMQYFMATNRMLTQKYGPQREAWQGEIVPIVSQDFSYHVSGIGIASLASGTAKACKTSICRVAAIFTSGSLSNRDAFFRKMATDLQVTRSKYRSYGKPIRFWWSDLTLGGSSEQLFFLLAFDLGIINTDDPVEAWRYAKTWKECEEGILKRMTAKVGGWKALQTMSKFLAGINNSYVSFCRLYTGGYIKEKILESYGL